MITINLIKNKEEIILEREDARISITHKNNKLDSIELYETLFSLDSLDTQFELRELLQEELGNDNLNRYYEDIKSVLTSIINEISKLELS